MNQLLNRVSAVFLPLILLLAACQAIQPPKPPTAAQPPQLSKEVVGKIEAKVRHEMQTLHIPALSVGIVMSDHVVYAQGFGITDFTTGKAVTPDTTIMLASVSKTFTAVAIMQLVEQGKIDLEAPFTKYLPDFKMADEWYKQVTIHQLLAHQGGIPDFFDIVPEYWRTTKADNGVDAMTNYLRGFQNAKLDFAPGTAWSYSTNGFVLLGEIIARISGQSYTDYIHDHIFKPLGMDHSSFFCPELDQSLFAAPYILDETKLNVVKADFFPYSRAIAPGDGLCSNVTDMTKWMQANLNRGTFNGAQILKTESYNLLWKTEAKTTLAGILGETAAEYGLGWYLADVEGHRIVSHAGGTAGFHASMLLSPNDKIGIIVLGNLLEYPGVRFYALDIADETLKLLWTKGK